MFDRFDPNMNKKAELRNIELTTKQFQKAYEMFKQSLVNKGATITSVKHGYAVRAYDLIGDSLLEIMTETGDNEFASKVIERVIEKLAK